MNLKNLYWRLKRSLRSSSCHNEERSAGPSRSGGALVVRRLTCACSECWARAELTLTCGMCGHKLLCTTNCTTN
jgi:hypothetical protein